MKCFKCGAEVKKGDRFCENCGAPVLIEGNAAEKEKKKKIIIALVAAVVAVAGIIGVIYFTGEDSSAYSEKLKLAEQYVAEGDLDAAEIQYQELIQLDPKKETAYIGLATDVYAKQDRYDEAIEVLEEGLEATDGSEEIEEAIRIVRKTQEENGGANDYNDGQELTDSRYSEEIAQSVNSSGCEIPKEQFLYDFLIRYWHYRSCEYDENNPVGTVVNIMYSLASDDMMASSLYNAEDYITWSEGPDPRGWQEEAGLGPQFGIMIADKAKADWLAKNFFYVSENGIKDAVKALESDRSVYAEGDKYYGMYGRTGMGIPPVVEVTECKPDGNVYYMALDFSYPQDPQGMHSTMYAKTEIRKIDGIWYWTLHSISEARPAEL